MIIENGMVFQTGEGIKILVDREFHIRLSTDKTMILSDGMDIAIVTAKLYNYEGQYQVGKGLDVTFEIEGVTQVVPLINGQCSIELTSEEVGDIKVTCSGEGIRGGEVVIKVG